MHKRPGNKEDELRYPMCLELHESSVRRLPDVMIDVGGVSMEVVLKNLLSTEGEVH